MILCSDAFACTTMLIGKPLAVCAGSVERGGALNLFGQVGIRWASPGPGSNMCAHKESIQVAKKARKQDGGRPATNETCSVPTQKPPVCFDKTNQGICVYTKREPRWEVVVIIAVRGSCGGKCCRSVWVLLCFRNGANKRCFESLTPDAFSFLPPPLLHHKSQTERLFISPKFRPRKKRKKKYPTRSLFFPTLFLFSFLSWLGCGHSFLFSLYSFLLFLWDIHPVPFLAKRFVRCCVCGEGGAGRRIVGWMEGASLALSGPMPALPLRRRDTHSRGRYA